jgi:hypothetical protein
MNLSSPDTALQELQRKIQLKKELDRRLVEQQAMDNFPYFLNTVFAASFDQFVGGAYVDQVARFLDAKRTARVGARDHFKSTSLYARFMWHLYRTRSSNFEGHYFSYGQDMSGYHIEKIKKLVKPNPYFSQALDLKSTADSVGAWTWDGEHQVTLDPKSLLSFKRGIHPEWIAVDDPFQDPENKLEPTTILKINDVFKKQILDMPKVGGELHVVGTAQTPQDFFFDQTVMRRFSVSVEPAIVSDVDRIARWPEHMDFDELMERREERGTKVFAQEYLCSPVYTEDAWLEEEELKACVSSELVNLNPFKVDELPKFEGDITAGWDLGKKRHPSHLAIFETYNGASRQIHSKWMEGWDYTNQSGEFEPANPTQLEYVKECCRAFGVDFLQYDGTRGELDALKDAKKLPDFFEAVIFTKKRMVAMATTLSDRVTQGLVKLLDDPRQTNQMLAVNNQLQAIESPQGHGDSFWSVAMALPEREEAQEAFVVLG